MFSLVLYDRDSVVNTASLGGNIIFDDCDENTPRCLFFKLNINYIKGVKLIQSAVNKFDFFLSVGRGRESCSFLKGFFLLEVLEEENTDF